MKKINIFSIIIILASSTNFSFAMEIDPIEQEKNFQFSLVLNNITSPYIDEKKQALETLSFLASTGYEPAICYIEQNNLSIKQTQQTNTFEQLILVDNKHYIIESLINNILSDKNPAINAYCLYKITQEAEKGDLRAAYCLQEMGFDVPNILKKT